MSTGIVVELALFQIAWWVTVAGAGAGRPELGPLAIAVYLALVLPRRAPGSRAATLAAAAALAALGFVLDSVLQRSGLIRFAGGAAWAPPWIAALWAQLAGVLPALGRLAPRPAVAALLGAVGGPVAYSAGVGMGAATLGPQPVASFTALAAVWACAVPGLARLGARAPFTATAGAAPPSSPTPTETSS